MGDDGGGGGFSDSGGGFSDSGGGFSGGGGGGFSDSGGGFSESCTAGGGFSDNGGGGFSDNCRRDDEGDKGYSDSRSRDDNDIRDSSGGGFYNGYEDNNRDTLGDTSGFNSRTTENMILSGFGSGMDAKPNLNGNADLSPMLLNDNDNYNLNDHPEENACADCCYGTLLCCCTIL